MATLPRADAPPSRPNCDRCDPPTPATAFFQHNVIPTWGLALCEWCDRLVGRKIPGFTRLRR